MSIKESFDNLEKAADNLTMVMQDYAEYLSSKFDKSDATGHVDVKDKQPDDKPEETTAPPKKKRTRRSKAEIDAEKAAAKSDEIAKAEAVLETSIEPDEDPDAAVNAFKDIKARLVEISKTAPKAGEMIRGVMTAMNYTNLSAIPMDRYQELMDSVESGMAELESKVDNTPPDLS